MNTKQLKAKVLDLAIHGKLLSPETVAELKKSPDYETADVLLEKIRKEKEEKIAKGELKRDKKDSYIFVGDDKRHYEKFADGTITDVEDELTFEVPEGWSIIHLQHIGNFQGGQTPKSDETTDEGTIPYFKVSDMNVPGNEHYMNKVSLYLRDSAKYKVFPPDSIIYPKNGGAVFTNKKRILTVNSLIDLNTGAYIPSNLVDNKYAYYLFSTIDFNKFYKGTSVPTVDHDSICELFFGLPPLVEQKEIVKQLSEVFKNIDIVEEDKSILLETVSKAKSKILDLAIHGKLVPQDPNDEPASVLLEKLRAEKEEKIAKGELKRDKNDSYIYKGSDNCYYEKFPDGRIEEIDVPFEIPTTWQWCKLGSICDYGKCISVNANNLKAEDWILDLEDIEKDTGKIIVFKTFSERKSESTKHKFYAGQVLYSKLRPYLNKVVIAPKDGYCTSEILPLNFNNLLTSRYAQILLMSSYFLDLVNMVTYGVKMPRLGTEYAKKMLIPLPPFYEQQRIVNKIDLLFNELNNIILNLT